MGVKAFNVTSLSKVRLMEPKEVGYQDSIDIIRDELHRTRRSFVKIGWYLKHIKDEEMFREDGYADIFELAMDKFSISQPTANRFMNICEEFSVNHDSPELDEKFVDFSVSQLFEMLPMDEENREQITPDMTVKQIREIKEDVQKKRNLPDDGEIRAVCYNCLSDIRDEDFENLKEYMRENYGKCYYVSSDSKLAYSCTPRGISINNSDEITWTSFVKRVYELNELIPFRTHKMEDDNEIPGQTSIEKDFPEYLPDLPEPAEAQDPQDSSRYKLPEAVVKTVEEKPAEMELTADLPEAQPEASEIIDADYREIPSRKCIYISVKDKRNDSGLCEAAAHCDKEFDCCVECQEPCNARCGWLEALETPEEESDTEQAEPVQPELPVLKNNDQRKAWLNDYKAWGLWYYDDHIDVNYYKYDFPDGSRLIIAEYPQRQNYWSLELQDEHFYHLLEKGKKMYGGSKTYDKKYQQNTDSETYVVEFLKNVQAKEKKGG